MATSELEAKLSELAAELDWPGTPDLARAVRSQLLATPWWRQGWQRGLVAGLVVLLAAVAILAAASPSAREAMAGVVGLRGLVITKSNNLPSPSPTIAGGRRQVSLSEATMESRFHVLAPAHVQAIWIDGSVPGGFVEVDLPDGSMVEEVRGSIQPGFFGKMLGGQGQAVAVLVNGSDGYWITGPHAFFYADQNGIPHLEAERDTPTLVWQKGDLLLRVENAHDQTAALHIAASLR